jgi:hypothetical protein
MRLTRWRVELLPAPRGSLGVVAPGDEWVLANEKRSFIEAATAYQFSKPPLFGSNQPTRTGGSHSSTA